MSPFPARAAAAGAVTGGKALLVDRILQHAHARPDAAAIVVNSRVASYRRFAEMIVGVRGWLEGALPPGDGIVAVCCNMHLPNWVTILALRSLGRAVIAVPGLDTLASLAVPGVSAAIRFAERPGPPPGPDAPPVFMLESHVIRDSAGIDLPEAIDASPFGDFLEFTSGTTGQFKVVRRDGAQLAEQCERVTREYGIGSDTVFHLAGFTPWSMAGSSTPALTWYRGGACLFDFRSDWIARITEFPLTRMFASPRDLDVMVGAEFPRKLPGLQVFTGGGFVSAQTAQALRRKLDCAVVLSYGATEFDVQLQSRIESDEDAIWLRPYGDAVVELVDAEGAPCPPGQEGELRVKLSASDPRGYVNDPEASARFFQGGYFHTGDLAMRRADGRIRILGRASDVLNVGGIKRPSAPLEAIARDMLGVEAACAFSRQDRQGVERLLVVVEAARMPAEERIGRFTAACRDRFPRLDLRCVPAFPRKAPMDKIDRAALLASLAD